MITGAAQADAALLIIDAAEGVRDQTRRHGYLLHLLGIHQVAVVINKMDRVDFDEGRFHEIEAEIVKHLAGLGLTATAVIPISARHGDGVAKRTASIAWHTGPTVLEVLDRFAPARPAAALALRIPVQAVYKFDDRRIIAGRVETGRIAVGDEIVIMPRGTNARVQTIEAFPVPDESRVPREADAGQSVGLTLDRQVFVDRGDLISAADTPAKAVRRLRARVFWLHEQPLAVGTTLNVRVGMAECRGTIALIDNAVDPGELSARAMSSIAQNHVGEVEIALSQPLAADIYAVNPRTGRIVLDLAGRIAGGGLVLATDSAVPRRPRVIDLPDDLAARASRLSALLTDLPPAERLARFRQEVEGRIVFTTSFGLEDQVITHWLCEQAIDIEIATLDTGRLFPETYELWAETERRYGRRIRALYPQHDESRSPGREARHQRLLRLARGPPGLLPCPQGRAAQPRARRCARLDRRAAGGPVRPPARDRPGDGRWRARPAQAQPAVRLDPRGGARLRHRQHDPDQPAAFRVVCLDRMRALHAGDRARGARAGRPLVVGAGGQEGVRAPYSNRRWGISGDARPRARGTTA